MIIRQIHKIFTLFVVLLTLSGLAYNRSFASLAYSDGVMVIDSLDQMYLQMRIEEALAGGSPSDITSLTISGELADIDLNYIATNLTGLVKLDMSAGRFCTSFVGIKFYRLTRLEELLLPSGGNTYHIEEEMFKDCTALRRVELTRATQIRASAFAGCSKLDEVVWPDVCTPDVLYPNSFSGCALDMYYYADVYSQSPGAFPNQHPKAYFSLQNGNSGAIAQDAAFDTGQYAVKLKSGRGYAEMCETPRPAWLSPDVQSPVVLIYLNGELLSSSFSTSTKGVYRFTYRLQDGFYADYTQLDYELTIRGELITGLTLPVEAVVGVGMSQTLSAVITPEGIDAELEWSSSDTYGEYLTIDRQGTIHGVAITATPVTVTVRALDGSDAQASCAVTVKPAVTAVTLPSTITLGKDASYSFTPQIEPATAYSALEWSLGENAHTFVSLSASGELIALLPTGEQGVTVTARALDGSAVTGSCKVIVKPLPTEITLDQQSLTLGVGFSRPLIPRLLPIDAYNSIAWECSDTQGQYVHVDPDGTVRAVSPTITPVTVTAKAAPGIEATCEVSVMPAVTGIQLPDTFILGVGRDHTLAPTVEPAAAYQHITWESEDASCSNLTLDQSGKLHGVRATGAGSVRVWARASDGSGISKSCAVTVRDVASRVDIDAQHKDKTLKVGEELQLSARVSPAAALDSSVTWSQSNSSGSVISLTQAGYLRALAPGTVTVTVTTTDGGYTDTTQITIVQPVTLITFPQPAYELGTGLTLKLRPTILPANASKSTLSYSISEGGDAYISINDGVVTGRQASDDDITITATATDYGTVSGSVKVRVYQCADSISISSDLSGPLSVGDRLELSAQVAPANARDKGYSFELHNLSSDGVLELNGNELIAQKQGTGTLVAISDANTAITDSVTVTVHGPQVNIPVTGVSLTGGGTLRTGGTLQLSALVTPADASDGRIRYYSSDNSIAMVTDAGLVSGVSAGEADIFAESLADPSKRGAQRIAVIQSVTGIEITPAALTLRPGESAAAAARVLPDNAADKRIEYQSYDTAIATVSAEGVVTAAGPGKTLVEAAALDGGYRASIEVTVVSAAQGVTLPSALRLREGKAARLSAVVTPDDAADKSVRYSSSNLGVATVNAAGLVTAVRAGSCAVEARTAYGGYVARCQVVVEPATAKLIASQPVITLVSRGKALLYVSGRTVGGAAPVLSYKSLNPKVVTVSKQGMLTAKAVGTAKVRATASDGKSVTLAVRVVKQAAKLRSVKLSFAKTMKVGSYAKLTVKLTPSTAALASLSFKSSKPAVLTVDSAGGVYAKRAGKATITVIANGRKVLAAITVK